jgi:hypothetical protein
MALFVLMLMIAGCSDPELEIMHQREVARSRAMSLPVDYRDIAFVVLKDILPESEFVNLRYRNFVSLFGSDLEVSLKERLRADGIDTLPGSAFVIGLEKRASEEGEILYQNMDVGISSIEAVGDDTYRVRHDYYCGILCAGGFESYVKFEAGMWQIIRTRALWYS